MTQKFSAREKEVFNGVIQILKKDLHPNKIILFGSRAKGNYAKTSDFDFAVDKEKPTTTKRWQISDEVDEIAGLYKVDIVYLNSVDKGFKNIVLKTGKIVYERKSKRRN